MSTSMPTTTPTTLAYARLRIQTTIPSSLLLLIPRILLPYSPPVFSSRILLP